MNATVHRRALVIAPDHRAFAGHFPGQPILPGVALLAEVLEAARTEALLCPSLGAAPRLSVVKFSGAVRPGAALALEFVVGARSLAWRVEEADRGRVVASGEIARADLTEDAS
jgi:3-hydroxymyristoyl/3-hydroxydecanoyl-(acyl carrier protein) dehydratase